MPTKLNIEGQRFGKLIAIKRLDKNTGGAYKWLFQCECGGFTETIPSKVTSGHTQSCGCNNQTNPAYRLYGARGITVCERWNDFETFKSDMGPKPTPDHTIERVDNDGNYEPSNCKWATRKEQANNRRYH